MGWAPAAGTAHDFLDGLHGTGVVNDPHRQPHLKRPEERSRSSTLHEGALSGDVASALVHLHSEHFGRGPAASRAYLGEDILVCVLTDVFTHVERTMLDLGRQDLVRETRLIYQRAIEAPYTQIVERIIGRRVLAFASTVTFNPDQAIEIFTLGGPIDPERQPSTPTET